MATKTVALNVEAYELLKRQKRENESFSDAVKRLARPRRPLSDFAGMWSDLAVKERRQIDQAYTSVRGADQRRAAKLAAAWRRK